MALNPLAQVNAFVLGGCKSAYSIISFLQAVMASDFAIAQFRFLERLLVVHGHWCYKRIAQMVIPLDLFYFMKENGHVSVHGCFSCFI